MFELLVAVRFDCLPLCVHMFACVRVCPCGLLCVHPSINLSCIQSVAKERADFLQLVNKEVSGVLAWRTVPLTA